jgi:hypothetical protein
MRRIGVVLVLAMALTAVLAPSALAARPGFGELYYDGEVVRTVVPPAAMPQEGTDNLYAVMGGADGQLPVAAVAPGDPGYRGGKWAFHAVTWNVTAYLLTSEDKVRAAETAGDVTITRKPGMDFKCPIQP